MRKPKKKSKFRRKYEKSKRSRNFGEIRKIGGKSGIEDNAKTEEMSKFRRKYEESKKKSEYRRNVETAKKNTANRRQCRKKNTKNRRTPVSGVRGLFGRVRSPDFGNFSDARASGLRILRIFRPRARAVSGFPGLFGRARVRSPGFAEFSAARAPGLRVLRAFRPRARPVSGVRGLFGRARVRSPDFGDFGERIYFPFQFYKSDFLFCFPFHHTIFKNFAKSQNIKAKNGIQTGNLEKLVFGTLFECPGFSSSQTASKRREIKRNQMQSKGILRNRIASNGIQSNPTESNESKRNLTKSNGIKRSPTKSNTNL
jgi:hypothetical protein